MSSASELESSLISFAGSDSTSTWQGRKDGKWGGGGQLFKGGNHFQYFRLGGGDYSREAINQGTAIIQGYNIVVHTDLWYASSKEKKVERLANLTVTIPTVLKNKRLNKEIFCLIPHTFCWGGR